MRRHPAICLLLLSPGIPEYLSSSSSLTALLIAPPLFLFFLALNLGLYGPGVLLIREAAVRWKLRWVSILTLGAAYGVLEEGVALSTFFNPLSPPVGGLGFYGHWMGVNWVWATGLVMFHSVFSIFLPILLLDLALPETRGRTLLTRPQLAATVTILLADIGILMAIVRYAQGFWLGLPLLAESLIVIGAFIAIAKSLPTDLLSVERRPGTSASPWLLFALGALLFPVTILVEGVLAAAGVPAALTVLLVGFWFGMFLATARSLLAGASRERGLTGLVTGAVASVMVFGFLAALPLPVVLVADALAVLFLARLWKMYSGPATGVPLEPGLARASASEGSGVAGP